MADSKQPTFLLQVKGLTAIQIGIYFLLFAFLSKQIIDGFIIDESPFGMLSVQILEILILVFILLFLALSLGAIYFKNRRLAIKEDVDLWNKANKLSVIKFLMMFLVIIAIVFVMHKQGYVNQLTSSFLIGFGAITHSFNTQKNKFLFVIAGLCVVLAMVSYLIPSYWYPSLLLVGLSFIVKGVVKG